MKETSEIVLAPPIEPSPVSMSYTGPGWVTIYVFLALLFLFLAIRLAKRYQKNSYRRSAVSALKALTSSETSSLIAAMSILKSTAMKRYGRSGIAGLSGMDLFEHLNRIYPAFDSQLAQHISGAIYSDNNKLTIQNWQQFLSQTENWIRKHGI